MEPFIGEIKLFGGNFAPSGWVNCDGSQLPIDQYSALFSLLGTTFGGDGVQTFGVPDMRGRIPAGSSGNYPQGQMAGQESVTLLTQHLPAHSHTAQVAADNGSSPTPVAGNSIGVVTNTDTPPVARPRFGTADATIALAAGSVTPQGNSLPHDNMMPYLGMRFIMATEGIYPSRP